MKKFILIFICLVFIPAACTPVNSNPSATPLIATQTPIHQTPIPVESAFAPGSSTAAPEETLTPEQFFTVYGDQPIVPNGADGAWDDRFTDPGAVFYYEGVFHMFRNGFRAFPAESQVGYVTSPDGYTWTKDADEPMFKTSDVPYAKIAMYASSALVTDDGTWVLYFYTWDSSAYPSSSVIGRATVLNRSGPIYADAPPRPYGLFVADAEPVLIQGAAGEWDEKQVLTPHVLQTTDGIQWTKYNDPATTEAPYAESDPVLLEGEAGAWDAGWVHQPRVFQTPAGWVMFYRGTKDRNGSIMKLGLATSTDDIHWERSMLNPLLKPSDVPGAQYFWFTNVVLKDDTYYLFWEVDLKKSTEIYLATHTGEITK